MTDSRPFGPNISGWITPPSPARPLTRWHRDRARHHMPRVVGSLVRLGYGPDELDDLDLQDAATLTIRLAERCERTPLAGMREAAHHLGLAALALQSAYRLQDALPHIANANVAVACNDFGSALQALADSIPAGRPAGTTQEETA